MTGRQWPLEPHRDQVVETMIVRFPDWITWWRSEPRAPGFQSLTQYITHVIGVFDRHEFDGAHCHGRPRGMPCLSRVTRFALYYNSIQPLFWCKHCDPAAGPVHRGG